MASFKIEVSKVQDFGKFELWPMYSNVVCASSKGAGSEHLWLAHAICTITSWNGSFILWFILQFQVTAVQRVQTTLIVSQLYIYHICNNELIMRKNGLYTHVRIQRGGGRGSRHPLINHKNIGFLINTPWSGSPKHYKAAKPAFNVGLPSALWMPAYSGIWILPSLIIN